MQGWDRHSSPGGPNTQFAINSCFYKMRSKCKCNFQVFVNILRLGKKPQIHKTQIFQGVRMERCLEDLMLVIPVLLWSLALFFFFFCLLRTLTWGWSSTSQKLWLSSFIFPLLLSDIHRTLYLKAIILLCHLSLSDHQIPSYFIS